MDTRKIDDFGDSRRRDVPREGRFQGIGQLKKFTKKTGSRADDAEKIGVWWARCLAYGTSSANTRGPRKYLFANINHLRRILQMMWHSNVTGLFFLKFPDSQHLHALGTRSHSTRTFTSLSFFRCDPHFMHYDSSTEMELHIIRAGKYVPSVPQTTFSFANCRVRRLSAGNEGRGG